MLIFNWGILIFIGVSFFYILGKGLKNDLVIYQNKKDFYRVIFCILFFLASWMILEITPSEDQVLNQLLGWLVLPASILATAILFIDSLYICTVKNDNKIHLGLLIASYRYFYIIFSLLIILTSIYSGFGKRRSVARLLLNLTVASSTVYMTYLLINGEAVNKKRQHLIQSKLG